MLAFLPLHVTAWATLNHLVAQQPGATARLKAHVGKVIRLRSGPANLLGRVDHSGQFSAANPETVADASLRVGFDSLLRPHDPASMRTVRIEGDTAFATDIGRILQDLSWDFEDDLSRVVGDVPAHLIAGRVRAFDDWARRALASLAHNFAEYWTYEAPLLASPMQVDDYLAEVSQLRDAAERLQKRVERLVNY